MINAPKPNEPILVFAPETDTVSRDFVCGIDAAMMFVDKDYFTLVTDPALAEVVCVKKFDPDWLEDPVEYYAWVIKPTFPNIKMLISLEHTYHAAPGYSSAKNMAALDEKLTSINQANNDIPIPFLALHVNHKRPNGTSVFFTDFMFNRMHALSVDQPDRLFDLDMHKNSTNHWYPCEEQYLDKRWYQPAQIHKFPNHETHWQKLNEGYSDYPMSFICPSIVRNINQVKSELAYYEHAPISAGEPNDARSYVRYRLLELLQNYPGFVSDPQCGKILLGNNPSPDMLYKQLSYSSNIGNLPLNHAYYDNSVLTINVETILNTRTLQDHNEQNTEVHFVSEKTWEPLLNGNFLLTFAWPGFYNHLQKEYDVKLPDWINYESFDNRINSDMERLGLYFYEVKRVLNLGPEKLWQLRYRDQDILEHNQKICTKNYRQTVQDVLYSYVCKSNFTKLNEMFLSGFLATASRRLPK
jgi:hypothetical protein